MLTLHGLEHVYAIVGRGATLYELNLIQVAQNEVLRCLGHVGFLLQLQIINDPITLPKILLLLYLPVEIIVKAAQVLDSALPILENHIDGVIKVAKGDNL